MRILVTGAGGFIGKNLMVRLEEAGAAHVSTFLRDDPIEQLASLVAEADAVIHLAGENRPADPLDFQRTNGDLTSELCTFIRSTGRPIPLVYTSSIQADQETPYGLSKKSGEAAIVTLAQHTGNPCAILRLPNIFGKWCRPNYNSAVATFCHNIARDIPITVNDPFAVVTLAYIDNVVGDLIEAAAVTMPGLRWCETSPQYRLTVGELADQIQAFADSRSSLVSERVGAGLTRALYATYVSYLPTSGFAYEIPAHGDHRGVFVEMLKTPDCGQFSFFTAHPGITRGGHYHHTKTEKFLVLKGKAKFAFRHIVTEEYHEIRTSGEKPMVVETVPGWSHDITNVGEDEMIVMLWANEIFDRTNPDTIARSV